jgi:hypothetical protein
MIPGWKVRRLSKRQILTRYAWTEEQLKGLPDHVLEALYAYSVSDTIDRKDLEETLERMGFGLFEEEEDKDA